MCGTSRAVCLWVWLAANALGEGRRRGEGCERVYVPCVECVPGRRLVGAASYTMCENAGKPGMCVYYRAFSGGVSGSHITYIPIQGPVDSSETHFA